MAELPVVGGDTDTWGTKLNDFLSVSHEADGRIKATISLNTQSGTSYTLALADAGKLVGMDNAAANTLTVPTNAAVAFPVGTIINLRQAGAGQTTVSPAGGVTLRSRGSAFKLAGQYAYGTLVKVATDTWELSGDIST